MASAASVSASLMSLISKAFAPNGILTRDNSLICCSTLNRRFAPHNNSGILFCARSPIHLENITASSQNAVLRPLPCRFCNQRRKRQLCYECRATLDATKLESRVGYASLSYRYFSGRVSESSRVSARGWFPAGSPFCWSR